MTSSYIEKVGVWDPRLVQEEPTFLVQKGALSNTVMPFQAISANSSQHTYQLQVPNLGVFTARDIRWRSGVYLRFNAKYSGVPDAVTGQTVPSVAYPVWQNGVAGAPPLAGTTTGFGSTASLSNNGLNTMVLPGKDICLSMFPLSSLCTNMQISVNDANVTTNGDTLREVLLLSNVPSVRKVRTTPTRFDVYANCRADSGDGTAAYPGSHNGNFATFLDASEAQIPNGAWPVVFYNPSSSSTIPDGGAGSGVTVALQGGTGAFQAVPAGGVLIGNGVYTDPLNGQTVRYMNGIPCWGLYTVDQNPIAPLTPLVGVGVAQTITGTSGFVVQMQYLVTEPIPVSPFLWRETSEMSSVGLFGCTNMQFTMNLQSPSTASTTARLIGGVPTAAASTQYWYDATVAYPGGANIIKCSGVNTVIDSVTITPPQGSSSTYNGFVNPTIFAQFLTPAPGISVPLISSVPYTDFPRYFSNVTAPLSNGGTTTFSSQTITLSSCPDIILVWVKPNIVGSTRNIPYVPITRASVTFDNFSNLCSNFQQQHLYACTTAAGIDMPWLQWSGYAGVATETTNGGYGASSMLCGGPLALRVGTDVTLSPGLAPGCLGNYSTQITVDLDNTNGFFNTGASPGLFPAQTYTMTIMPVSSGMFETCQGSSTIRRTILNTSDVISVTTANSITTAHLHRLVGGSHMLGHCGTALGIGNFHQMAKRYGAGGSGGGMSAGGKRGHDMMLESGLR
jgi:hypothetical protein